MNVVELPQPWCLYTNDSSNLRGNIRVGTQNDDNEILTAITSGFTLRYFPFPHPTSAIMVPGGSEDRKWHTSGQGEWRVLLKWEAMELYTLWTYSFSK